MSSGRINSRESLETANRVFRTFGSSWRDVESASVRRENGVRVIDRDELARRRNQNNSDPA